MRESCLASLSAIFQNRSLDPQKLAAACKEAIREQIHLAAGKSIRADAALLHYGRLRPEIRARVDRWIADRFAGVDATQDDAHRSPNEPPGPVPAPEPGLAPGPDKDNVTQRGQAGSRLSVSIEDNPLPALSPCRPARFENDPFDRFLDWVSSLLQVFRSL